MYRFNKPLVAMLALMCFALSDAQPVATIIAFDSAFFGIKTCLPFSVFVAPYAAIDPNPNPAQIQPNASDSSTNATGTYPPVYPPTYPPVYPSPSSPAATPRSYGWAEITADQTIIDALNFSVYAGELTLSLSNTTIFVSSNRTINITIVPAGSSDLTYYVTNYGLGDLILSPGSVNATGGTFLISAKSAGGVIASGLNTSELMIQASGSNTIFVNGSYPSASINSDGTSSIILDGINPDKGTVSVEASGISSIWIIGGSGTLITGRVAGLSKVSFSGGGKCTVVSNVPLLIFGFPLGGASCSPVTTLPLGMSFRPATFSCGLNVSTSAGSTLVCGDTSTAGQSISSSVSSGGGSAASSSSSSGGGTAYSSSDGSGGTAKSNGGTAVSTLPCLDGPPVSLV